MTPAVTSHMTTVTVAGSVDIQPRAWNHQKRIAGRIDIYGGGRGILRGAVVFLNKNIIVVKKNV